MPVKEAILLRQSLDLFHPGHHAIWPLLDSTQNLFGNRMGKLAWPLPYEGRTPRIGPQLTIHPLQYTIRSPLRQQHRSRAKQTITALNMYIEPWERLPWLQHLHPQIDLAQFYSHRVDIDAVDTTTHHIV